MWARSGLYLRTVRHIPPTQLLYFMVRRLLPTISHKQQESNAVLLPMKLLSGLSSVQPLLMDGYFHFLNQRSHFTVKQIDWRAADYPKLWRYNLHYFDWLKNPALPLEQGADAINQWIQNNPAGSADAWEPYTASLRLVNWLKFFFRLRDEGKPVPTLWLDSLEQQGLWLENHLEYHIRANHLFKNLVAMVWFHACVDSTRRARRLAFFCDRLLEELQEQFYHDGGHYERSPLYHAICLEDCLDTFNVLQAARIQHPCVQKLKDLMVQGLNFLDGLTFPDGRIALFGDSVLQGAHSVRSLRAYWARLAGGVNERTSRKSGFFHWVDTGYLVVDRPDYRAVVATGGPAPAYQPGHAHCDMGSFELFAHAQRLVVDSGVSQYAPGDMRQHVRSSCAHNVIQVNGENQHEIWGEFRMAARGSVEVLSLQENKSASGDCVELVLKIQPHAQAKVGWTQIRTFHFHEQRVEIQDQMTLQSEALVESRVHFHPDLQVVSAAEGWRLQSGSQVVARIQAEASTIDRASGYYCPDFGVVHENPCLCLRQSVRHSARLSLVIRLEPAASVVDSQGTSS